MGSSDDLRGELAAASLFVLSSRGEGMPMVLLEAMACGLPAVSFDCQTGPAELIGDGRSGVLVPPARADLLADALSRAIADPASRRSMGAAARARAEDYAMERIVTRWEELFAELADARGLDVG
jgi:glycosyltransferase involved in cell wall biosynthesis